MTSLPTDGSAYRSRRIASFTVAAAAILAAAVLPASAFAQATRTWVSGVGDDANPCSRTAPCKTFAGAISKTATQGEINVLDPGGFGGVTITKSITIKSRFTAGVLVSGTNGVIINAGVNDRVTLDGLDIDGLRTGINGVTVLQAGTVRIMNSHIYEFASTGVNFAPTNAGAKLQISDTTINNNTNTALTTGTGVAIVPGGAAGSARFTIKRSEIDDNINGITASSTRPIQGSILHSEIANNNGTGIQAVGGSTILRISDNDVVENGGQGLLTGSGGILQSFGNNRVAGNNPDGAPNGTGVSTRRAP
jgi:hypothetical protein